MSYAYAVSRNDHGYSTSVRARSLSEWEVSDDDGWSLAHKAAIMGALPLDFDYWDIEDDRGYTVAHAAASVGALPSTFTQWSLLDKQGNTVAHTAAYNKRLPEGFDQWDLRNDHGDTVAHVAARQGCFPIKLLSDLGVMSLTNNEGVTVAQEVKARRDAHLANCQRAARGEYLLGRRA